MPALTGYPTLTILLGTDPLDITVTVFVRYSELEICIARMCKRVPVGYLYCELFGKDKASADDHLHTFTPNQWLYAVPPLTNLIGTSYQFKTQLQSEVLNEDHGFLGFNERDEIYAKVSLYDDLWKGIESRNSNVELGWF